MRLQISTQLAIFAVLELAARDGQQLSVADIGEKYGVSSHHLAKVMHVMGRAGLVRSVRGAGGGYQFAGNARRTTLLDVVQLFEDANSVEPDGGAADATPEGQALRQVLSEIDDIARATLGSITIATMRKLVDRHATGNGRQPKAGRQRQRGHWRPDAGQGRRRSGRAKNAVYGQFGCWAIATVRCSINRRMTAGRFLIKIKAARATAFMSKASFGLRLSTHVLKTDGRRSPDHIAYRGIPGTEGGDRRADYCAGDRDDVAAARVDRAAGRPGHGIFHHYRRLGEALSQRAVRRRHRDRNHDQGRELRRRRLPSPATGMSRPPKR